MRLVGYPSFGFIIDKDGNIETAAGNVEQVLGMSSVSLLTCRIDLFCRLGSIGKKKFDELCFTDVSTESLCTATIGECK